MCLYPRLIKNRKYTANKRNRGIIPEITDPRVLYVPVGCGECIECTKQKARGWQVRLLEDLRHNTNGKFITLTFSNESIKKLCELEELHKLDGYELDNAIAKKATRMFLERWRKKYGRSLRHWLVTELGHNGTENIHLHGIVWTDEPLTQLEKIWQYGFVWKGKGEKKENYVSEATINYITKYITKRDEKHKHYKPKILTSPGIGKGYTERLDAKRNCYNGSETREYYKTRSGHKIALPIYWRNKIYNDNEREKLWLNRLDKNERYVCGERIRADDTKGYFKLVDWHRERNKELGYGDGKRGNDWWDREVYEQKRRKLMLHKRIQKE